jgi:hypothetical protein
MDDGDDSGSGAQQLSSAHGAHPLAPPATLATSGPLHRRPCHLAMPPRRQPQSASCLACAGGAQLHQQLQRHAILGPDCAGNHDSATGLDSPGHTFARTICGLQQRHCCNERQAFLAERLSRLSRRPRSLAVASHHAPPPSRIWWQSCGADVRQEALPPDGARQALTPSVGPPLAQSCSGQLLCSRWPFACLEPACAP